MPLHPTRHDLPAGLRAQLAELLNLHLAAALDLGLQAKQAHWAVKGPHFLPLHELFDKLHASAGEAADELAERCAQLGGQPRGSLQALAKASPLKAYPLAAVSGEEHLQALAGAQAAWAKGLRQAVAQAEGLKDPGTADLFTELSREADKQLWFLESHLHGRR